MKNQIFIAAGGRGRRLGILTENLPKSLIPINDRPLISCIVETAIEAKIQQIIVGLDDGKTTLEEYLKKYSMVEIEKQCVEPLTTTFFHSVQKREPDIAFGVNGDTLYHPSSLTQLQYLLEAHPEAAGAVHATKLIRPVTKARWKYWRYKIDHGVVDMEGVFGHKIETEYIAAAFRGCFIKELSKNFTQFFEDYRKVPFHCYSLGWDYILRLFLWKGFRIVGLVSNDLSLNINYKRDVEEAQYFFTDTKLFRRLKSTSKYIRPKLVQFGPYSLEF